MNDNTILRIKVPAHLYESVKQQLTLNEAKAKPHYGAGMEVVKEKKVKVPKDGMKKVEEEKVEENVSEAVDPNLIGGILGILLGGGPIVATILKQYKDAKTPEEKAEVLKQASQAIGGKMSGKMEEKKEVEEEKVEETVKEGEDKTNPELEEKAYPYFDANNVDRHDEIVDLFPIVYADLKKNTNIYAGLVIDLLFHWVHGTKETGLMKLYKDKFLKKGKNK